MRSTCGLAAVAWLTVAPMASAQTVPPPTTAEDVLRLTYRLTVRLAPIQSRTQFDAYMASDPSPTTNPFHALSADAQRRFLASLDFAGFRDGSKQAMIADLENELSLSQAWRLLALLGQQELVIAMPDIRVVTDDDKLVDAWRKLLD